MSVGWDLATASDDNFSKQGPLATLVLNCSSEQRPAPVRMGLDLSMTKSQISYHGYLFNSPAKITVGTSYDTNSNNINKCIVLFADDCNIITCLVN